MQNSAATMVVDVAREMFAEAYRGPGDGYSWFTNHGPDAGLFGLIETLTAAQASQSVVPDGRSIAAHIEHLRWSLALINEVMRGGAWNPDWAASWSVQAVDDNAWNALKLAMRDEFDRLHEALAGQVDVSDPMTLKGLIALAPHAAHHLGTVRLMARLLSG
ncbi:MAG: DinB family protein [Phycisphaeraceae bacterium]|nr:DinB family protein [Phycisphaeraceae bacterium]